MRVRSRPRRSSSITLLAMVVLRQSVATVSGTPAHPPLQASQRLVGRSRLATAASWLYVRCVTRATVARDIPAVVVIV